MGWQRKNGGYWERRFLVGLLILILVLGVVYFRPLRDFIWRSTEFLMDQNGARVWVLDHQPYSVFYYIALCAFQVVISPIPGELTGLLGGIVFGWSLGFVYSTIGLTIGSLITVTVGRAFERVFLERIIPARYLDRFEARVGKWGLVTVFILFLFPGGPKDTLCYLFGLSRIPVWSFLIVSSVARLPGTLVLTLQGANVFEGDWIFFAVLTACSMAIMVPALIFKDRLYRKFGINDGGGR